MFTGIIEKVGTVLKSEPVGAASLGSRTLMLATGYEDLKLGESVAINGVCLTVAEMADTSGNALFFLSPETCEKSNLGILKRGEAVNLERALQLSTKLSGHIVQGHVDGKAFLQSVSAIGEAMQMVFDLSPELGSYCVDKGSVSLNGVSLTINSIISGDGYDRLSMMIVPHSWKNTNLSQLSIGQTVNCEVDVLSKYVAQHLRQALKSKEAFKSL